MGFSQKDNACKDLHRVSGISGERQLSLSFFPSCLFHWWLGSGGIREARPYLESQGLVVQSQRDSNEFEILANQFRDRPKELAGGIRQTFSEFIKTQLGTQDAVTEFRRKFNQVSLSEGLKNLQTLSSHF